MLKSLKKRVSIFSFDMRRWMIVDFELLWSSTCSCFNLRVCFTSERTVWCVCVIKKEKITSNVTQRKILKNKYFYSRKSAFAGKYYRGAANASTVPVPYSFGLQNLCFWTSMLSFSKNMLKLALVSNSYSWPRFLFHFALKF